MRFFLAIAAVVLPLSLVACDNTSRTTRETVGGLYTDEEVRHLTKEDIDKPLGPQGILGAPYLDVVPAGTSSPRSEVFKKLGIQEERLQKFSAGEDMMVAFLNWRISPSYDLNCMTATNDPKNKGEDFTDPQRLVYGIRLIRRQK